MLTRLLMTVFLFACGLQAASAGVMVSSELQVQITAESLAGMSVPEQPEELPRLSEFAGDYGMTGAASSYSSTTHLALPQVAAKFTARMTGSRLRIANASLPPSPITEGLLKPS